MREKRLNSSISALAALLMLAVFAAGIFAVLISGATVYKRLTLRDNSGYNQRTAVQYINTKLRQSGKGFSVEIGEFGDGAALRIHQSSNGLNYVNQIYCYDGYLMELFSSDDGGFSPEDGERLLELQGLDIHRDGGLLSFYLEFSDGSQVSFNMTLRGEWEAAA